MAQATINARLNATVKERGDKVLRDNGISTTEAIRGPVSYTHLGEPVLLAVVGKQEAPGLNFRVLLLEAAQALGAQVLLGFHLDGVDGTR